MDDLISRQWLMECVEEGWIKFDTEKDKNKFIHLVRDTAPSAQPERKKGSWNVIQGNIVVCSECGMLAPKSMTGCLLNRHLEPNRTNFCPNCGADMRGEQNEH